MAFEHICDEIKADLAAILPDEDVHDQPPDAINAFPVLLVYPQPRTWTIAAVDNATGELKYSGTHDIVVEWITNRDNLATVVEEATPIADAITLALFTGFMADRFGGTVHHLNSITCEAFGPSLWDATEIFQVRFLVNVTLVETTA